MSTETITKDVNETSASTEDVKTEATAVDLSPTIDQEKMAKFEAWQQSQAIEAKKEELLRPLGGEDGYKSAIAKIQSTGNVEFLKQVNEDLKGASTQATGVAKIQAFVSAMGSLPEQKAEEPMFGSILPEIGGSTASAANTSSNPNVSVKQDVSFDGVKDPAVQEALTGMNKQMMDYNLKNPNSYKDQHLVGLKALNDSFNPLIKQAEAFKDYDKAQEAMTVYAQAFSQLAELGAENGDKTLVDFFNNAKSLAYQGDLIEKTIQSDQNARLSYKDAMFSKRHK